MRLSFLILSLLLSTVCHAQETDVQELELKGKVKVLVEAYFTPELEPNNDSSYRYSQRIISFDEYGRILKEVDSAVSVGNREIVSTGVKRYTNEYDTAGRLVKRTGLIRSYSVEFDGEYGDGHSYKTEVTINKYKDDSISEQYNAWWPTTDPNKIDSSTLKFTYKASKDTVEKYPYSFNDTGWVQHGPHVYSFDKSGRATGEHYYMESGIIQPVFLKKYNELGQLVMLNIWSQTDGSERGPLYRTYNDQGQLSQNIGPFLKTIFEYSILDWMGNYLERVAKTYYTNSVESYHYPISVTTRQIEYYP